VEVASSREMTVQGQVLGTPAYMAPEQAEGRLDLLDERTDVYSLGVILYEILTGQAPFVGTDLEVIRRVTIEDPLPPRERVPETPRALEAICQKALAKNPAGRYQSATALGKDLQQFLADEPVSAYPEPPRVQLARWARRHRTLVSALGVLLLAAVVASVLGIVVLGRANRQIEEQRDLAVQNSEEAQEMRQVAERSRDQARAAEQKATKSAAQAKAINDFLVDDLLGEAATDKNPRSKNVTVEEVVRRAGERIDERKFADQPEVEGSVRATVGQTLYRLGAFALAEEQLRKALAIRRRVLGPDHADTLDVMDALGEVLWAKGDTDEGLVYVREALTGCQRHLGPDHKLTMTTLNNYALLLQRLGKLTEVEPLWRQQVASRRRVMGPHHTYTINSLNNLARCLLDEGKLAEAESVLREALADARRTPDDPIICALMSNLGSTLTEIGNPAEAEPQLHEALDACIRIQGADHPYTVITQNNMCRFLIRQERFAEAEPLCRQNREACQRVLGAQHYKTFLAMDNLAVVLMERGNKEEAGKWFREALNLRRKVLPPGHYGIGVGLVGLGDYLARTGKPEEAEPLLRQAVEVLRQTLPQYQRLIGVTTGKYGDLLVDLGRFDEAQPHLLSSYESLKTAAGATSHERQQALAQIVKVYSRWGKAEEAAQWRAKQTAASKPP
jgi:tetratricopeptide (TPR) repeat protein